MNKKLLSVAVAAAIAAPAAALADAVLYGKAHVSMDYFKIGDGFKGWTMSRGKRGKGNSRASRIGVKGSEELTGGLKGIYQIELGVPLANESNYHLADGDRDDPFSSGRGAGIKMRNSYVGLESKWGTLLFGRHDTPFKLSTGKLEMFNDTMADYEGTLHFHDVRADNTVAYMSPNWKGFSFAAAAVPGAASTVDGTQNDKSDGMEGYSVAAIYGNGPWHVSAAYEVLGSELGASRKSKITTTNPEIDLMVPTTGTAATTAEDFKKIRVGLGMVDFHGFTLTGLYENWKNGDTDAKFVKDEEMDLWQLQTGYRFGNSMIKGMYGEAEPDTPGNTSGPKAKSWAVGLDHKFSKRTKVYALYTEYDWEDKRSATADKDDDWEGFSFGVIHNF